MEDMATVARAPISELSVPQSEDLEAVKSTSSRTSPESAGRYYLPELDILRFVAFLWMFYIHASISFPASDTIAKPRILWTGFYTIDLFFALSAYLLTQLLMREWGRQGVIDVGAFYVRRLLRVWPLYFFFIALAFALSVGFRNSSHAASFTVPSSYFIAFLVFAGNFTFCRWSSPVLVVTMLWTLSIEEQVYLVLPWMVRKGTPLAVALAGTSLIAIANFSRIEFAYHNDSGVPVWFNTLTHLDSIGIGILLAAVPLTRFSALALSRRIVLAVAGIVCWFVAVNYYYPLVAADAPLQEILSYPLATLGCGAILAAVIGSSTGKVKSLFGRSLVYLGKISYGLYVFHGLGITLTILFFSPFSARAPTDPFSLQLLKQIVNASISFALTLCMGACSYRWLEAPFLRLKERFTVVASRPV
jgi:peptidoglycan/LPS O-acetylase OafA/YrhL